MVEVVVVAPGSEVVAVIAPILWGVGIESPWTSTGVTVE